MTVLANAITASTSVIHISAPLTVGSYQAPYTLDSEAVLITRTYRSLPWVEPTITWDQDPDLARIDVNAGGSDWATGDFWAITQALVGSNVAYATGTDANTAPSALPRAVNGGQNRPVRLKTPAHSWHRALVWLVRPPALPISTPSSRPHLKGRHHG